MAIKVIFDTDPGIDDAVALCVAMRASRLIEFVGITTVGGNVDGAITYANACSLIEWLDHPVRVYQGCPGSLSRTFGAAAEIHGENGFGGVSLPKATRAQETLHGVSYLIEACRAAAKKAEKITLCPIGPLTNLAIAVTMAPDIAEGIERIVLMGGAYGMAGNISPYAEFNIWSDPQAAQIIFNAAIPKVMVPLDVTEAAPAHQDWIDDLPKAEPRIGGFLKEILNNYHSRNKALHDPCVSAFLIDPSLFSSRKGWVQVTPVEDDAGGKTTVTWDEAGDTEVLTGVDDIGVRQVIFDALAGTFGAV